MTIQIGEGVGWERGDKDVNDGNVTARHAMVDTVGEGKVSAAPDQAVLVVGTETQGKRLSEAQQQNATAIAGVIQSLLQLGVPRERIQTVVYRIETEYDYPDGVQTFRGYKVIHLLQVTSDRPDQAGQLADAAVDNGANVVQEVRFALSHEAQVRYEAAALTAAAADARRNAQTLAGALGFSSSVEPVHIHELGGSGEAPRLFQAVSASVSDSTPIEPGLLTVTAGVRVWFRIYPSSG
ncbi:SIMPL domain-containing protein [Paenibacillus sp. NPDC058071]|uniref:SIMPL domain-containing protein n=1 Tax=Paenibacillus sp. NPDC058071 TaxID=3346326 RepID=UPI0036DA5600